MQFDFDSTSEKWRRLGHLLNQGDEHKSDGLFDPLEKTYETDSELQARMQSLLANSKSLTSVANAAVIGSASDPVPMSPVQLRPGLILDHYQVSHLVGTGGMGHVYLAQDLRLQRKVALKVLPPVISGAQESFRRFEAEARAISALNHPNILTIYDFAEMDGLHFIVTEFVEGDTVRRLLSDGPMEQGKCVQVGLQIAAALAAAHSNGIIHRDIKPENIIIRADGVVKVLDFGIAKLLQPPEITATDDTGQPSFVTKPGLLLGTPQYMSPEQARGLTTDPRTDIFSLGVVLYEALAGKHPFQGETRNDVIAEILKSELLALSLVAPQTSEGLERVVAKCLAKDRTGRYIDAKELLTELQNVQREISSREQQERTSADSNGGPIQGTPGDVTTALHVPMVSMPPVEHAGKATPIRRTSAYANRTAAMTTVLIVLIVAGYLSFRHFSKNLSSTQPRSLAVLPFRNLKQDPQTDFLGFSLADAVITKLGYIKALAVRPSASIDKFRSRSADMQEIAADLQVDMLLTGSFIRDGDDLRVMTQLVKAKSNTIIWRNTFDVKYDRLLAVQDRVAQLVVKGLELELSPAEQNQLKAETQINSPAYEYFLRGVDLYSIGEFSAAANMLEKSVGLDPHYAPTWAYLGRAYTTHGSLQAGGLDNYKKAQAAYEKAIALNPSYPEPRVYMANLLTDTGRVEQAVPLLKEALGSSPNNAEAHWELGYAYRFGGMLTQSVAECERARRLDPEVKINSSALNSYLYLGQYDKFLRSLPVNDSDYLLFYKGLGEYYKKNWFQAATDFDRSFERSPSLLPAQVGKAISDALAHREADGHKLLHKTEEVVDNRGVSDPELFYKIAQAYAVLEDRPSALRLLQRAIEGGFFPYSYFASDALLDNVHRDARFESLLQQAHIRQSQFERRFFN